MLSILVCAFPIFANGTKENSSAEKPSLVYWTLWNEAEPQGRVIAEAVEAFTAETGIKVEVVFNGRDIRKTLQPALDAGETIDIFDEGIERVSSTWGKYLLPLDTYVEKSYPTTNGRPYKDVVNQTLLNLAYSLGDGSIKTIPYQPYAMVWMYNKDLFDKAGIKQVPTTWDEFLVVCEKLKAIGVTPITTDDAYMVPFFGYCMDRMVGMDEALRMARENDFTGPAVLEFGKIWEDMSKKGYMSRKAASNIYPTAQLSEMATGTAAMYFNGTWLPNEIKDSAPNMNWGAFAWPAMTPEGDGVEANEFGGEAFGINKNSKYPDEAFQLIVWLTTGKWDAKLAEESMGVPIANDSQWPKQLAEAKTVFENTTKKLPVSVGMEDNPDNGAKIKENFAKLIAGSTDAAGFAAGMRK